MNFAEIPHAGLEQIVFFLLKDRCTFVLVFVALLFCFCGFLALGFGRFWLLRLLPFVVLRSMLQLVQTKRKL